ncbi:MAG: phosphotransferase enzyme family protein, partial [Verrucomicrobium sp.]
MLSKEHLQPLAAPFGLDPSELTFVASSQNHVYRGQLASGRQVILRISEGRFRSKSEVLAELDWIAHLASRGISVCRPVPALDGGLCISYDADDRECVVTCFEHAPGTKITAEHLKPSLYKKLGTLLGDIHAEAASYEVDAQASERAHGYGSRLICQDFDVLGDQLSPTFRSSVANLVSELRTWPTDPSSYGLIHGDVSFGNCHIHDED